MIFYRIPCPPNTRFVPVKYCFLEPTKLTIGEYDASDYDDYVGRKLTYCFGIGDTIEVLQPERDYMVVPRERLKNIPIVDKNYPGGIAYIFDPPESIKLERVI